MKLWFPRVGFIRLDGNRHIYRAGKYGPKFGTRRKGFSLVQLGANYTPRNVYGVRLWCYRHDGSCWSVEFYFWNGKHESLPPENVWDAIRNWN